MKSQLKMPAGDLIASIYKFYFSGIPGLNSLSANPSGAVFRERWASRSHNLHYLARLDSYWTVDGADGGSGAEFVNHSCDPNLLRSLTCWDCNFLYVGESSLLCARRLDVRSDYQHPNCISTNPLRLTGGGRRRHFQRYSGELSPHHAIVLVVCGHESGRDSAVGRDRALCFLPFTGRR